MFAVETKDLTKIFGSYRAVDGLNLRVPEGSIYGFLGPNGAGKTTTIKMLTGLSKPSSGEILLNGKQVEFGNQKNRIDIGYLPDVPNFYSWMKPDEFLKFSGEMLSVDKKVLKKRIEELLELVGLQSVKKKIGGFSRGMKQRLGIAQALISEPRVVFLDEPTSALDPIGRKEVLDIIAKLGGRITVFFSTHILSDIEKLCDRVVILNKGKVMIEDSIQSLREKYSMNVVQIEVNGNLTALTEELTGLPWVNKVSLGEHGEARITVNNMGEAQVKLPGMIYDKQLELRKFELLEPDLEDIFLKVVNQ
ncbi:MAG: ABC transporter ATP-binding protein [Clostridia bacterium]|nr:ABC transporter ATP-binding protein [Clostridia bacterium]